MTMVAQQVRCCQRKCQWLHCLTIKDFVRCCLALHLQLVSSECKCTFCLPLVSVLHPTGCIRQFDHLPHQSMCNHLLIPFLSAHEKQLKSGSDDVSCLSNPVVFLSPFEVHAGSCSLTDTLHCIDELIACASFHGMFSRPVHACELVPCIVCAALTP